MPVPTRRRTVWSLDDIKEILTAEVEDSQAQERLRSPDSKGLSPVAFAALKAATTADSLTPLLGLLQPPTEEEASRMDLVLQLLEGIAGNQMRLSENQVELGRRMAAIESRLGGTRAPSPRPSTTTVLPASGN